MVRARPHMVKCKQHAPLMCQNAVKYKKTLPAELAIVWQSCGLGEN
jgi:hypothetical protein